jgi:hypothetical protein
VTRLPPRELVRSAIIAAAAVVFTFATIKRFHWLGGPYFEFPQTIQDHVWPERFASADAILLCKRVAPTLRRGASATVIQPSQAPNFDQTHWLTGLGMLPRQRLVPPNFEKELPDYVLALREPFEHEAYRLIGEYPEGKVYERK